MVGLELLVSRVDNVVALLSHKKTQGDGEVLVL